MAINGNKKSNYQSLPEHHNGGGTGEKAHLMGADAGDKGNNSSAGWWCKGVVIAAAVAAVVAGIVYYVLWQVSPETFVPYEVTDHPNPPSSRLWGEVQRPYPTGAWWLNLGLGGGDSHIATYPYVYSMNEAGPSISYSASRRLVKRDFVVDIFAEDLRLQSQSPPRKMQIQSYDQLGVTERYLLRDGSYYDVHLVKGSPFTTIEYNKVKGSILAYYISFINGASPKGRSYTNKVTGTEFIIENGAGQVWAIFTSEIVTFRFDEIELWMTEPYTGVLRVAYVSDVEDLDMLRKYSTAYATGGDVDVQVEGDRMIMKYKWKKHGEGELLMLAVPHHMDIMSDGVEVPEHVSQYICIKGKMTPLVGDVWTLVDGLSTISWDAPTPITNKKWKEKIREQLKLDVVAVPPNVPDSYGFGKELGRMGRIALMAHELNVTDVVTDALDIMEEALTHWLLGENSNPLLYDKSWGGMVTTNGVNDEHEDFGNGWYNDHHFHYGYFVYAAAVICRFRPSYCSTYGSQIGFIVSDIANSDPNSKFFPMARHKDFFDFHSWASGIFEQGNGKSQESVSEAINAYYGVYLYGLAIKDDTVANWGRVLMQMEIRAGQKYWQMPVESHVYDAAFRANKMVGVVSAMDVVAHTWFGDNLEYVHCINMMPFLPVTEELLSPSFVAQEYPALIEAIKKQNAGELSVQDEWRGFLYLDKAIVEPEQAWDEFLEITQIDSGNSLSNALYWIATRPPNGLNMTDPFTVESGIISPQCDDNSACAVLGLKNFCCPTETGVYLQCCPQIDEIFNSETSSSGVLPKNVNPIIQTVSPATPVHTAIVAGPIVVVNGGASKDKGGGGGDGDDDDKGDDVAAVDVGGDDASASVDEGKGKDATSGKKNKSKGTDDSGGAAESLVAWNSP